MHQLERSSRLVFLTVALLLALPRLGFDRPLNALAVGTVDREHPATTGVTTDLVFARLLERNRVRESRLQQYSVPSIYRVTSAKGKVRAEAQVMLRFRAPDTKEFTVVSESGSGFIRNRVFKPLMESEVETAAGRYRYDSSVTPNNYTFTLLGEEDLEGAHCFVMEAKAKRADKYLFNGKVWIHASEYAIVRIAGKPAKPPSVWIKTVEFVRQYQKVRGFWLPLKNESVTQVRFFGANTLTIDYDQYQITQVGGTAP